MASPRPPARALPPAVMREWLTALRNTRSTLLAAPSVVRVDVGYPRRRRGVAPRVVLRAHSTHPEHTRHALNSRRLHASHGPFCVLRAGRRVEESWPRLSPLVAGAAIGNVNLARRGTLGAIVFDQQDGSPCAVSCWHVLVHDRPQS